MNTLEYIELINPVKKTESLLIRIDCISKFIPNSVITQGEETKKGFYIKVGLDGMLFTDGQSIASLTELYESLFKNKTKRLKDAKI